MQHKRRITGTVISAKSPKTITIQVEGYRVHPKYKKRVQFRAKYYAHDELNEAKVGDVVTIEECRPLSALKRFRLVSIDKKGLETVKIEDSAEVKEVLHEEAAEKEAE
jgi:small subunit ribosomal protein S17